MKKKIAFIHPDLGIGGAEQLVVNLCLAARSYDYEPHIFTPYHHQSFPETHDGTIVVHQHGSFFGLVPATILGRFKGLLAYIRSILCVIWLILHNRNTFEVVVADQVSVVLPLLRLFGIKTIFYCHYPDKLLSGKRNIIKKIYRFFIDLVEELSLFCAQKIYVNSEYTQEVFNTHFKILRKRGAQTTILYPSIDLSKFDEELKGD
jgi:alpha-1,3/alpha-1,6-mannosyltransferase